MQFIMYFWTIFYLFIMIIDFSFFSSFQTIVGIIIAKESPKSIISKKSKLQIVLKLSVTTKTTYLFSS